MTAAAVRPEYGNSMHGGPQSGRLYFGDLQAQWLAVMFGNKDESGTQLEFVPACSPHASIVGAGSGTTAGRQALPPPAPSPLVDRHCAFLAVLGRHLLKLQWKSPSNNTKQLQQGSLNQRSQIHLAGGSADSARGTGAGSRWPQPRLGRLGSARSDAGAAQRRNQGPFEVSGHAAASSRLHSQLNTASGRFIHQSGCRQSTTGLFVVIGAPLRGTGPPILRGSPPSGTRQAAQRARCPTACMPREISHGQPGTQVDDHTVQHHTSTMSVNWFTPPTAIKASGPRSTSAACAKRCGGTLPCACTVRSSARSPTLPASGASAKRAGPGAALQSRIRASASAGLVLA